MQQAASSPSCPRWQPAAGRPPQPCHRSHALAKQLWFHPQASGREAPWRQCQGEGQNLHTSDLARHQLQAKGGPAGHSLGALSDSLALPFLPPCDAGPRKVPWMWPGDVCGVRPGRPQGIASALYRSLALAQGCPPQLPDWLSSAFHPCSRVKHSLPLLLDLRFPCSPPTLLLGEGRRTTLPSARYPLPPARFAPLASLLSLCQRCPLQGHRQAPRPSQH